VSRRQGHHPVEFNQSPAIQQRDLSGIDRTQDRGFLFSNQRLSSLETNLIDKLIKIFETNRQFALRAITSGGVSRHKRLVIFRVLCWSHQIPATVEKAKGADTEREKQRETE
jgi:hypothetical protein